MVEGGHTDSTTVSDSENPPAHTRRRTFFNKVTTRTARTTLVSHLRTLTAQTPDITVQAIWSSLATGGLP